MGQSVRKNIEKTSSNVKNRAVVLWEYSYNGRGNFQIFRKLSFILKQYLAGTQDITAVIVMGILSVHYALPMVQAVFC